MNRVFACIGAFALVAIGTVALTVGTSSAGTRRAPLSTALKVHFSVRGDLASITGQSTTSICATSHPEQFEVRPFKDQFVDVAPSFYDPRGGPAPCMEEGDRGVIWQLTSHPKSDKDLPEIILVTVHYAFHHAPVVHFVHSSPDLRATDHVSGSYVMIEITGK